MHNSNQIMEINFNQLFKKSLLADTFPFTTNYFHQKLVKN